MGFSKSNHLVMPIGMTDLSVQWCGWETARLLVLDHGEKPASLQEFEAPSLEGPD